MLRAYFQAWLPILSRSGGRAVYIDAFAGPGRYTGGEDGSPIVVVKAARDHEFKWVGKLVCIFIEADQARFEHLKSELEEITQGLSDNISCRPTQGRFIDLADRILLTVQRQAEKNGPTLVFIDPFGFSHTPFAIIKSILSHQRAEVLVNFMFEEVNRFISLGKHAEDYDELFGTDEWRALKDLNGAAERKRAIHNLYLTQLKTAAKYVHSFEMRNASNSTDYFLYFATNSMKGVEKMKEAMWRVDETGSFQFSDFLDAKNQSLLPFVLRPDFALLEKMLRDQFQGQIVSIETIEEWVLTDTPFLRTHVKSSVLAPLEREGLIRVEAADASKQRRRGTYPPGTSVHFIE